MTAEAKAWVAYIEYHKQHPAGLPFSAFLMMEEGLCGDRIITSYGPNCDPFTATCDRDKGHDGQHIDHHDYANWESEAMSSQRRERAQRANAQHHEVKTITPRAYKCYMTDCAIPATEHYGWLSACKEHDLD